MAANNARTRRRFLYVEKTTAQAGAADNAQVSFQTTTASDGIAITSNQVTLPAGGVFLLEASIGQDSSSNQLWWQWYSVTGAALIGQVAVALSPNYNDFFTGPSVASAVIDTATADVIVEVRVQANSTLPSIAARGWLKITELG